jgi:hypothetical protein
MEPQECVFASGADTSQKFEEQVDDHERRFYFEGGAAWVPFDSAISKTLLGLKLSG